MEIKEVDIDYELLIVIHESLIPYEKACKEFQSPLSKSSYHAFIRRDGEIIYLTPANEKVEACFNSSFNNESIGGSVDCFAYHICLESPYESVSTTSIHKGYSSDQYYSLAWLISRTGVLDERIVKHSEVDKSGLRLLDPRSFNKERLLTLLKRFERSEVIKWEK